MEQLYKSMKEFVNVYKQRIRPLLAEGNAEGAAIFISQELIRESSFRNLGYSLRTGEPELAAGSGNREAYGHYLLSLKLLNGREIPGEGKVGEMLGDRKIRNAVIERCDFHIKELEKLINSDGALN